MIDVFLKQQRAKTNNGDESPRVIVKTDKPVKSLLKSISWRIVGTIDTMLISYFVTGRLTMALSIGSVEVLTKTILYYFHERAWLHIHKIKFKIFAKCDEGRLEFEEPEREPLRTIRFGKS